MPAEERQRLLERVNEKLHDVLKLIRTFFDLWRSWSRETRNCR